MNNNTWLDSVRKDFPALDQTRNGLPPIYFDNACTTLVPRSVIEAMDEYYTLFPACGGWRSRHWFAQEVTRRFEGDSESQIQGSRSIIKDFINAASEKEIIFTLNTTHAINIVALGFSFKPPDVVLLTNKEHNSNLIPWLRLQKQGLVKVEFFNTNHDEVFDLQQFEFKMAQTPVKLVSMGFTSNLTGYTIPAKEIIRIAHRYGAKVLLDGAQTIPHQPVDVQDLDVDFLAFSVHKMCGPKGVGVLYAKKDLINRTADLNPGAIEPAILGGGTVIDSNYDSYRLLDPPERFEAGVLNYPGLIAAGIAVQYLQQIGMKKINAYELQLNQYLTQQLLDRYGDTGWFHILGPQEASQRGGILTFEVKRPNSVGISEDLSDRRNIMIRDGAFCVHSFLNHQFGPRWAEPRLPSEHRMVYRISLYFYNTLEECRTFLDTLNEIFEERCYL